MNKDILCWVLAAILALIIVSVMTACKVTNPNQAEVIPAPGGCALNTITLYKPNCEDK